MITNVRMHESDLMLGFELLAVTSIPAWGGGPNDFLIFDDPIAAMPWRFRRRALRWYRRNMRTGRDYPSKGARKHTRRKKAEARRAAALQSLRTETKP